MANEVAVEWLPVRPQTLWDGSGRDVSNLWREQTGGASARRVAGILHDELPAHISL